MQDRSSCSGGPAPTEYAVITATSTFRKLTLGKRPGFELEQSSITSRKGCLWKSLALAV